MTQSRDLDVAVTTDEPTTTTTGAPGPARPADQTGPAGWSGAPQPGSWPGAPAGAASWPSGGAGGELDTGVPQSARVYDFLLGGKDNFEADRAVGSALVAHAPALPVMVRAQRALLARFVTYLVREAGVRQFLDIGTGIPSADNVHEVAQRLAPESRVLYVDNDPIVLAHARALMKSHPGGRTAFIQADLRDVESILAHPSLPAVLDADRPVALLLIGILHHLPDEEQPYALVRRLVDWLPSGSYLAVATPTGDFDPSMAASVAATAQFSGIPFVPRGKADVERFLDGLEQVDPGVVPMLAWHPDGPVEDPQAVHGYAGLARKP